MNLREKLSNYVNQAPNEIVFLVTKGSKMEMGELFNVQKEFFPQDPEDIEVMHDPRPYQIFVIAYGAEQIVTNISRDFCKYWGEVYLPETRQAVAFGAGRSLEDWLRGMISSWLVLSDSKQLNLKMASDL